MTLYGLLTVPVDWTENVFAFLKRRLVVIRVSENAAPDGQFVLT